MKFKYCSFFLGLFLLGSALASQAEVHQHDVPTKQIEQEVFAYVNQYRVSHGLRPLVMNEAANQQARQHSLEMAKHQVPFGHDGFQRRMTHLHRDIQDIEGGAENVAYHYKTAKIVVDGWIKSAGHRHNIEGRYDTTGIGIVRDGQGRLYFTQLFVRTNHHAHPHSRAERVGRRAHFYVG